jgi:hypothetical protein
MENKYCCLIKKNTPELCKKLEELGYQLINSADICIDNKEKNIKEGKNIFTSLGGYYGIAYEWDSILAEKRIDCEDNEDLFLGIAAITDKDDKNQYFVLECNLSDIFMKLCISKGSFVVCEKEDWAIDRDKHGNANIFSSRNIPAHKATVEELTKHFNNK